ncbi:hypothetical protein BH10PAT1_BH10PAT1_4380 [soil metagenome]
MSDLKTIETILKWNGKDIKLVYKDTNSFQDLPYEKIRQCYGVCFYGDKIVVGGNGHGKWNLIGGTVEKNEKIKETLKREIQEESNMKLLKFLPIGSQHAINPDGSDIYQLRYVCKVKPFSEFKIDPAGSVTEIKLIDPKDFKKYVDWGEIGDRLLERAMELKDSL